MISQTQTIVQVLFQPQHPKWTPVESFYSNNEYLLGMISQAQVILQVLFQHQHPKLRPAKSFHSIICIQ